MRTGAKGIVKDAEGFSKKVDAADRLAGDATSSPSLKGDPYHPKAVAERIKPPYQANPAHDPRSPLFNPKKTPEPKDVLQVYAKSVRGGMGTWYGKSSDGNIYRYFSDNAGAVHFSGIVPKSNVPASVLKHMGM